MPGSFRDRLRQSVVEAESRLIDSEGLDETLQHLVREGAISERTAHSLREALPSQLEGSRYVLRQLGAHFAIGVVFAFDLVPLPLGTIARVAWVAANRIAETIRRNGDRARVHSVGVLVIAAIPWLGYGAYLLPLRRESSDLAFVLANHSWLTRTGRTYEQFLREASYPLERFGRWLIPAPAEHEAPPGP